MKENKGREREKEKRETKAIVVCLLKKNAKGKINVDKSSFF